MSDGSGSYVFNSDKYKSVEPGYWNFNLNRAARGHGEDVIAHPDYFKKGGGHEDANGTSFSERVSKFSPANAEVYMNQAPGAEMNRAFTVVGSWICDGWTSVSSRPSYTECCDDSGAIDGKSCVVGHRDFIMQSCLQIGCGFAGIGSEVHKAGDTATATCDCYNKATTKYSDKRIAAASHVREPGASDKYLIIINLSVIRVPNTPTTLF